MKKRIIFHVDVNSAFLSWEAAYRIRELKEEVDLRQIPSAVGGSQEKRHGIILAKSIPAKAYRIQTGEPVATARRKCPELVIVKPQFDLYVKYSNAFIKLLKEYSPIVEQYSIDEAFMDMTGMEGLHHDLVKLAHEIKERIYRELGFTVNIGISTNKLLAKMASDFKKPNLVHTLFPEEIQAKMWPLPVRDLLFVGKSAEKTLRLLGIKTIGDLAKADDKLLTLHLKKHGIQIKNYANGHDVSEVMKERNANKGYGNSLTLPFDIASVKEARPVFLSLSETVGSRLRNDEMAAYCIGVSIVDYDFKHTSMQTTLNKATNSNYDLYHCAIQLFERLWDHKTPIRQLGIATSKLSDTRVHQLSMFEPAVNEKHEKLDRAIDAIRKKFGEDAIKRATFLEADLESDLKK